eukprot:TRINITY_DN14149_c0_g1_i1.p1 TRINITY_DN14149_c0_g1~~TRINITY_DN14149_c0_g1_i1.p1  ORF type:complete len:470 (-),score=98.53 TRINITY_DN14149_c0_g1_i1:148-1518(-)
MGQCCSGDSNEPQYAPNGQFKGASPGSTVASPPARRALLIGINYRGLSCELNGCINDMKTLKAFLELQGWRTTPDMVHVLTEDEPPNMQPRRQVILDQMRWLVQGAKPGDSLFLGYSGHGSQLKDLDGDEVDGKDETLVPLDFASAGEITDDEMFDILVKNLPQGAQLTAIADCCHSGTVLDLPYGFVCSANPDNPAVSVVGGKKPPKRHAGGQVILFSGCSDEQTSADINNIRLAFGSNLGPGGAGGACINALVTQLCEDGPERSTFQNLLLGMRSKLKERGFTQVPQLSTAIPLDLAKPFSIEASGARLAPMPTPDPVNLQLHNMAMSASGMGAGMPMALNPLLMLILLQLQQGGPESLAALAARPNQQLYGGNQNNSQPSSNNSGGATTARADMQQPPLENQGAEYVAEWAEPAYDEEHYGWDDAYVGAEDTYGQYYDYDGDPYAYEAGPGYE